ncbi:flagellar biosynthesis protein FlhF [Variovorax boronicumulans]|uniref:flagellar biosynthesis protein FlhF n=1 Tax=Variovorax boronicumulans TaxID=436515 RepID=UPI001C5968C7
MNIQRFHAPTAREALALARAAFGDATLILSNRQVPTGVEVMAATEEALAPLETAAEAPAAEAAATPEAAPAPVAEDGVQADVEQLAMSTLSFQDYVRERMLRRQHGQPAPAAVPREDKAPPPPRAAIAAPVAVPAPIELPAAPVAAPAAPDTSRAVLDELDGLKRLMEERFNTLAWLGQARQDPIHSNLMLKLVRAGYSPTLARTVLEPIPCGIDVGDTVRAVMEALQRMLPIVADAPTIPEEGGVFALIGATGVGKTTTIAKLAAQCARQHGTSSVGLITLDTHRAGAHEQLRAYGRGLGVVAHLAHDRAALQEMLGLLSGKRLVLIDTAGIAPRDLRRRELLDLLDLPAIQRVLVLNAGAHGDTLDDIATAFKPGGTQQAVLTKIDEASKLGPALDVLIRHQLQLRGVGDGQRIPEDWQAPDAEALVRSSMRAAQRSPFDPRTADMDFFFSPAACAV